MNLRARAKEIIDADNAGRPEDIFGAVDGGLVSAMYRRLMLEIHPDHFVDRDDEYALANRAFTSLTNLRSAAERKLKAGTYGNMAVKAEPPKRAFSPFAVSVRGRRCILDEHVASGDLSEVYTGYIGETEKNRYLFKVISDGTNNDLAQTEARVLDKLYPPGAKEERFYRFLPKMHDTFVLKGPGYQRRVNVMQWFPEHRGLDEVLRVFPDGIDFRDMVWMFKRILHGIGHAHENQVIHGALLPPHVMIHPVDHGAKIIDWSYAVELKPAAPKPSAGYWGRPHADVYGTNPHVCAISNEYRDFYPPEVLERLTPSPATDIYIAARTCMALIGGTSKVLIPPSLPRSVAAFFQRCLASHQGQRPQNAWDAHEELDHILQKAVGKRKYRPFPMPARR